MFCSSTTFYAQRHDEQKYKQIKSMEVGPWDFSPGYYYWLLHKNYSGAQSYWKWRGFHSRLAFRFKEEKSNVKRVLPVRSQALAAEVVKQNRVEEERKLILELQNQELERATDRNVDLVYNSYKDDFAHLNRVLLDGFAYILKESNNKLTKEVSDLSRTLNLINERIASIHKTGIGYELENVKREEIYIQAKSELEALVKRTQFIALSASILY